MISQLSNGARIVAMLRPSGELVLASTDDLPLGLLIIAGLDIAYSARLAAAINNAAITDDEVRKALGVEANRC